MSEYLNKRSLEDSSNGYGGNDNKRQKVANPASRVLHLRGIPQFATEAEIVALCRPFGSVTRTLIIAQKHQAFIEMDSIETASALLSHYNTVPAFLQGKPVYFQYSNRAEIQANPRFEGENKQQGDGVNNVLLVTVLNPRVPVTIENLYQVFSPYGTVRKIITFVKNNQFQALVEMASVDSAITAKLHLEGKDMFMGCCTLQITFSKLTELSVKQNGPRSRDFSMPYDPNQQAFQMPQQNPLMSGGGQQFGQFNAPQQQGFGFQQQGMFGQQQGMGMQQQQGFGGNEQTSVVLVNNLEEKRFTPQALFTLCGVYGDVMRVKILYNKKDTAMVQFATPQQAYLAQLHLNRLTVYGKELSVRPSKHREVALPRQSDVESVDLTKDYTDSPLHRFRKPGSKNAKNICAPSPVLFVSNMPDDVTDEEVYQIFGKDKVLAIEFFKTGRKMAFIRMPSTTEAVEALIASHNLKLRDRYIRISFSHKEPSQVGVVRGGMDEEKAHQEELELASA